MCHVRSTIVLLGCVLLFGVSQGLAQGSVSQVSVDSAMANLRVIAGDIGPRPMGSPAEHRAMEYALERLRAFGCDDTFLMPMRDANGVNTTSGIAVGVLKGESKRIILIGGHMDSAGPEIPGADDDGSGAALVLELARVLCQQHHHSTIVFCLWGGEEQGLRGSNYFVAHYAEIDSIALMLQLDMVDGKGPLDIDPDGPYQVSAPRWLVDAAYEEFYGVLHARGLRYPSRFATINSSGSGSTGSDHIPFIEHGIPAIDFTSDVEYPIHTPLDNLANFTPSGFSRAGNVVLRLVDRFDKGQPTQKTEKYFMVQLGEVPLFIPHWFITLCTIVSILGSIFAAVLLFRRDRINPQTPRIHGSGAKVFLAVVIVNCFVWLTPSVMGRILGYRFPWANHFGLYVAFSMLVGLVGAWLALRLLRRMKVSTRVGPMFVRGAVLLVLAAGAATAFDLEIAIYMAAILALFTVAVWFGRPWIGAAALLLACVIGFRFVFSEATGLFQRSLTATGPDVMPMNVVYHLIFIGLFTLLTLPYGYALAALLRSVGRDFLGLRSFVTMRGLAILGCAILLSGIYVGFQKPYDKMWEPSVIVRQAWNALDTTGRVRIISSEPFHDLRVHWEGRDTVVEGGNEAIVYGVPIAPTKWVTVSSRDSLESVDDTLADIARTVSIRTPVRPYRISMTLQSSEPFELSSWRWSTVLRSRRDESADDRSKVFEWYSFPDTNIVIPLDLRLHRNQKVVQHVEVTFDTLATPIRMEHFEGYTTQRMTITQTDSLRAPQATGGLADAGHP